MENEKRKRLRDKTNIEICDENELKSVLLTNIVDESISKSKIRATLQIIAKALASTLGPDGATTILQDIAKQHLVTKDGLDVINKMSFSDEIASTVLDLLKNASLNQVLAVGDGSTSTIIVANALYQELTDPKNAEMFKYVSPKAIVDMLNALAGVLEGELRKVGHPVSEDLHEIAKIASIAMNNDDDIGCKMREIYSRIGKYGFIDTDIMTRTDDDVIEYKKGISWDRGFIDPVFVEKYEAGKIIHDKPYVFITNGSITIDDCDPLMRNIITQICGREKRELVIVANYVSDEAKNYFATARSTYKIGKPELVFTVVDMDQVTETGKYRLKDLALMCGCEVWSKGTHNASDVMARMFEQYTKPDKYMFFGTAAKVTITKSKTEFICDDGLLTADQLKTKANEISTINAALDELGKVHAKSSEDTAREYMLKNRKSDLENTTVIFHVGGRTFEEQKSRERLIEDAIFASKSAINYGYIVGGNITIPRIIERKRSELASMLMGRFQYLDRDIGFFEYFVDLIEDAFLQSYRTVLENSKIMSEEKIDGIIDHVLRGDEFYNLKLHRFEKDDDTSVINSTDTDLQIMKSTISIIGLLATSNQVITLNYNVSDQIRDNK